MLGSSPLHLIDVDDVADLKDLLDKQPQELAAALGGPTLVHLRGQRDDALVVSSLLHGNEPAGWRAMTGLLHELLRSGRPVGRDVLWFIGNVDAAAKGARRLHHQLDFNRIWSGLGDTEVEHIAQDVLARFAAQPTFATVDIHNTTGRNPPYACVTSMTGGHLELARKFSDICVFADQQMGRFTEACSKLGSSITIECGTPDHLEGSLRAQSLLTQLLDADAAARLDDHGADMVLYESFATVTIDDDVSVGFDKAVDTDVRFTPDLDASNFARIAAGTPLGRINSHGWNGLRVRSAGQEVQRDDVFVVDDGVLKAKVDLVPQMLTPDPVIIHQDCLCYLLAPLSR